MTNTQNNIGRRKSVTYASNISLNKEDLYLIHKIHQKTLNQKRLLLTQII